MKEGDFFSDTDLNGLPPKDIEVCERGLTKCETGQVMGNSEVVGSFDSVTQEINCFLKRVMLSNT